MRMVRIVRSAAAFLLCAGAFMASCAAAQVEHAQALRSLASVEAATRRAGAAELAEVGRMSDVPALVKALRDPDEETRTIAEAAIWEIWGRSGDANIDELYRKGLQLMNFGAAREAIQVFTLIINQKPAFAEGWNKRATLYYSIGEYEKSLRDCDEVVKRNPSHFGALAGYGLIYLQLGQPDRAVDYFERALNINPNMQGVAQSIRELEQRGRVKRKTYI